MNDLGSKDPLWKVVKILPSDYTDYGGNVVRWQYDEEAYPDCSAGCKHWRPLYDPVNDWADADWGICSNPIAPRAGLLTWEHQTGFQCYEYEKEKREGQEHGE